MVYYVAKRGRNKFIFDCFLGSLFEKSSAKTFILKVFNAHSTLDQCIAIIDCFFGRRGRRPLQLILVILCVLPISSKSVGEGLAPPEKKQI